MRKLPLIAAAALSACATAPAGDTPPQGSTPGRVCSAEGGQQFVGQAATEETGSAIRQATNSSVLRWARPGMMMTMEYRSDRVTVHVGPDNRITQVACG
jgi:hypothetical protein